jgi:hypothetical protein
VDRSAINAVTVPMCQQSELYRNLSMSPLIWHCTDSAVYMGDLSAKVCPRRQSCIRGSHQLILAFALCTSILFETCLFALTLSAAVSQLKDGQGITSLYRILYRDGILYFFAVFRGCLRLTHFVDKTNALNIVCTFFTLM